MTTEEELSELVDRVLCHAEQILGQELSRGELDKWRLKHEIVAWLAILKAVMEFMEKHGAAPRSGQADETEMARPLS